MKKLFPRFSVLFLFVIIIQISSNAQTGTWTQVATNAPHYNRGVCLLMTDGTVICKNNSGGGEGTGWDKLTPDIHGSYVNGRWTSIANMNNDRLFFSSQVLPSGKVYVAGGEYGAGGNYGQGGEVYDPVANTWTNCGGLPGGVSVYDGNSEILYNGIVLQAAQLPSPSEDIFQWSPSTLVYTTEPNAPLNHDEAAWLKLPDSSVLYIGINSQNSARYLPKTNTWLTDANTPNNIYDPYGEESGCAILLPNGKAIFFGSTQFNCIYTPTGHATPGTWAAAANMPTISGAVVGQVDAPGAMMVNGHILLGVSPGNTSSHDQFRAPIWFIEYNYITNTFTQVTSVIPGLGADSVAGVPGNFAQFLDLPDGTVLMSICQESISNMYWVYTPGSGPIAAGKPTITSILPDGCPNYKITGKLFNGISEGAGFGDDWQMETNYPLVRLSNGGNVYYAKTTNWNRIGAVQTGNALDTAEFTLPAGLTPGTTYNLVVTVNGFASDTLPFTTLGITIKSQTNISCNGGSNGVATANTAIGGTAPYTYLWSGGLGTNLSISGKSAGTYTVNVTDNNGCVASATVTITQPAILAVMSTAVNVNSNGACNGQASVTPSGGTAPYTYIWNPGGGTNDTINGKCKGTYCCVVTDFHGCSQTSCATIYNVTGIADISNASDISIYPDPNKGSFTVSGIIKGQVIELYNTLGQKLSSSTADNTTMYFDISNKVDGIYLVRILNKDGAVVRQQKILKAQ